MINSSTKKYWVFSVLIFLISCSSSFETAQEQSKRYQELTSETLPVSNGKTLPDFLFIPLDSFPYTGKDIPEGKKVWVMNFNPGCAHCQQTALAMSMRMSELENTEIIMVSRVAEEAIRKFAQDNKLNGKENVHFFMDPKQLFYNYFGIAQVPLVILYNEQHQWLQTFESELDFEDILSTLNAHKSKL